jgi:4a-hydroxytetrahydrobiopterin dehydratase
MKLKDTDIRNFLETSHGWVLNKGRIEKTFEFTNFARAAVFFNKIVNPIEENEHYPQIFIAYNRLVISLFSQEANSLTDRDLQVAQAIDALYVAKT